MIRLSLATALAAGLIASAPANAQGTLRIGMTAADIPLSWGQPDQGFEGFRFMGLMIYDALLNFDLTSAENPSGLYPALAESWSVDPSDKTKWTFKLRKGVKFHDGTEVNAEAIVLNHARLLDEKSPAYSARMASLAAFRLPAVKSYRAVDEYTVEFVTHAPEALLPYQICYTLISSPTAWEKAGRKWEEFAKAPAGTGPWKLTSLVPRERAEFVPFKEHWDKTRIPKLDKVITLPIPDASARTSALLSGQVDCIEAPAPDAVPQMKSRGFAITSNYYPHIWSWHFSRIEGSPWNDVRVRKAANLAIDREGMKQLLGGFAVASTGHVPKGDPWYGSPKFEIKFDPAAAKKLLAEAGYGPGKPVKTKMAISASGSGQMQPLAMNEYMQQNLKDVGIEVEFEVVEWQALLDLWRAGAKAPQLKGAQGVNVSYAIQDPFNAFTRFLRTDLSAPKGVNFGYYSEPEMDALLGKVSLAFEPKDLAAAMSAVHTKMVDDALFLWVVHDTAPRAMSTKVKGFVQAKNWFQSLTPVYLQ